MLDIFLGDSSISFFSKFTSVLFFVNLFFVFVIIFLERKNASASLAWIMLLFLFPLLGIFIYLLFSQNIARMKMFKLNLSEQKIIVESLEQQNSDIIQGNFSFNSKSAHAWQDLIKLNQKYGMSYYSQDNSVKIFSDGKDKFNSLLRDIKNAKQSINIEYFIIKNDAIGRRLIDVLTAKAREGVEIRLLVDALGSRTISNQVLRRYLLSGGRFATFFPPKFKFFNIKFNYRNHRKLAVIDGEIGYIGGFNIPREYLGLKKKFGYWRDTHLRIEGTSVQDINARFILDWRFASKEKNISLNKVYLQKKTSNQGHSGVQIISSGPDSTNEEIKRAYMKMITSAEKNVYLQTPYFVPDSSILESMKMAAQSGIDVRIMIPKMPDHIFVYWATYSYVGELLKAGCRVYIYDKGFLHSKVMVVDGEVMSVGSANFDRRSFKLNFEANAIIYDGVEAKRLESIFYEDIRYSKELTLKKYESRGRIVKIKESISILLSDIL